MSHVTAGKKTENNDYLLMLGDCMDRMSEIESASVDAIICDPPFNIVEKIGSNIHIFRQGEKQADSSISKESMAFDIGFDQLSWISVAASKLKKGGNMIIFNDWENMGDIAKEARANKLTVKCLCHWQKPNPTPAEWRRRFVAGREYFIHITKGGKNTFNVDSLHFGSFNVPLTPKSEKGNGKHPNQKPLKLMHQLIEILTNEGDVVLDPFMGSGSTGVSCRELNRKFIGIEKDDKFFELARSRIYGFASKKEPS